MVAQDIHGLAEGFETTHVQTHIGSQYAGIAAAEAEVKSLESDLREQTSRIRALEFQKEQVLCAVWNLKNKRLEEQRQRQHEAEPPGDDVGRRRSRIRKHFRNHVSDVEYKREQSLTRLERDRVRKERNGDAIQGLEIDIFLACCEVGKNNPDEVYDELSGGPDRYLLRDPAVEDGREGEGGGSCMPNLELTPRNGSEFTDSLAKPSPLRIIKDGISDRHPLGNDVGHPGTLRADYTGKGEERQEMPASLYGPVEAADYIDDFAVRPPPSLANQVGPGPSESELDRIYTPSYMEAKAMELCFF